MKSQTIKNSIFLLPLGVCLSLFTGFLGAPFFYALRLIWDRRLFWGLTAVFALAIVLYPSTRGFYLGFVVFLNLIAGSLFCEFRLQKKNYKICSYQTLGWGVFISGCVLCFFVLQFYGIQQVSDLQKLYEDLLSWMRQQLVVVGVSAGDVDLKKILYYLPSFLLIFIVSQITTLLYFEKRIYQFLKSPFQFKENFYAYTVPRWWLWGTLIILANFLIFQKIPVLYFLFINLLWLFIGLYFFQGFAICYGFYRHFNCGKIFRFISNLVIFLYLMPLVCVIGLIDYWVDIRKKLNKENKK